MFNRDTYNEIRRLNFEDFIWTIFVILSISNILGDYNEKEFLKTDDDNFKQEANKIFEITLTVSLLIYIYFFVRNYYAYEKATPKEKELFVIKLLGSSLLIAGVVCLLYFQKKQTSFAGSPAI